MSHYIQKIFFVVCVTSFFSYAELTEHTMEAPNFDRWMYPYNPVPGDREMASTFSSIGGDFDFFDERDAQVLLGFITKDIVQPGYGASQYQITEATLLITIGLDGLILDTTSDPWESYDLSSGILDGDDGRPIELFGAAFRSGYDGWTFGESGSFPFGASIRERNAYPISYLNDEPADVSNNVLDMFDPIPFAIARGQGVSHGEVVPTETVMVFDINVSDPAIQCYLKRGFDEGLVSFVLTSLHEAQQPGVRKALGLLQPTFHMKESWAVYFGLADPAQFSFTVQYQEASSVPEDLDGNGFVGVSDLLLVLANWGSCGCCIGDLNADGEVDISELLSIIAAWSQ